MISFDVVLLFTAIPVDRACEHIRNKLSKDDTLGQRSNLIYPLTISLNSYVYALLCQTAISTIITRCTNRFTVVLWAVPLALLWQTSVWRKLRN